MQTYVKKRRERERECVTRVVGLKTHEYNLGYDPAKKAQEEKKMNLMKKKKWEQIVGRKN